MYDTEASSIPMRLNVSGTRPKQASWLGRITSGGGVDAQWVESAAVRVLRRKVQLVALTKTTCSMEGLAQSGVRHTHTRALSFSEYSYRVKCV